jgi:hypothetical protein
MWPVFQEGDLLHVETVTLSELRVGDCVTYRLNPGGALITHRIIAIHGKLMQTRGDACRSADDLPVTEQQLIGRVTGRFRLGSFKRTTGGIKGLLAGRFYCYAGRLDPHRSGRGGRFARFLRCLLQWMAIGVYRRGRVRGFGQAGQGSKHYWFAGQRSWARFDHERGCWLVPWPQSLLIDPNRLTSDI